MKDKDPLGYSGKSLSSKLGLKSGLKSIAFNAPPEYGKWLNQEASVINSKSKPPWDFVHLFVNKISELEDHLFKLRSQLNEDGMLWVSWYKKSAGKPTEITEDI